MIEATIDRALDGERLDRAVAALAGCARGTAATLVDAGAVLVDGTPVTQRSRKLHGGEHVSIDASLLDAPPAPPGRAAPAPFPEVPVRYADAHLLVVAKPAGLVVHPAPGHRGITLVDALAGLDPAPAGGDSERPGIVHRLDRDTSGLLIVARSEPVHVALSAMLKRREITRIYDALVDGVIEHDGLTIDAPIGRDPIHRTRRAVVAGGRDAVTDLEIAERLARATLVRATLRTGRTHQIRVHLAAIDHPVGGDRTYGASARLAGAFGLERPFLHAAHLRFVHPVTGDAIVIDEPLPSDLVAGLERARRDGADPSAADPSTPPHRRPGFDEDALG